MPYKLDDRTRKALLQLDCSKQEKLLLDISYFMNDGILQDITNVKKMIFPFYKKGFSSPALIPWLDVNFPGSVLYNNPSHLSNISSMEFQI